MEWRGYKQYIMIAKIVVAVSLLCQGSIALAQEFQTSKDDFVEALKSPPAGLLGIVVDRCADLLDNPAKYYDELNICYGKLTKSKAPIARSLILFDFDSARIKDESLPILHNLADALNDSLKKAKLVVAGHTDNVGTDIYNIGLSARRAQAVRDFLVYVGEVNSDRLVVHWYGEREPYKSNKTKIGRRHNRRVEFIRFE